MNRTLEEILNTPVEFKEGMRVFSLLRFKFGIIGKLDSNTDYPIDLLDDNGDETIGYYTIEGKLFTYRPMRHLLTEQEAYELFPSLKPKVYEYQVLCEDSTGRFNITGKHYISKEDFLATSSMNIFSFVELYQPSKRERKA